MPSKAIKRDGLQSPLIWALVSRLTRGEQEDNNGILLSCFDLSYFSMFSGSGLSFFLCNVVDLDKFELGVDKEGYIVIKE